MRATPLLVLLLTGSALAYVTPQGGRVRWAAPPQPGITSCSADLPLDDCRAAVAAAFATWAAVDGAPLPLPALVDGPADVTVGFVADRPDLRGVLGVTLTTTDGDRVVAAEVLLNDDFRWSIAGPRGTFRVQATATHEIGHALGLAHSADRAATMYWHYDEGGAALGEDDRRGLRFLYGDAAGLGGPCDQCALPADCADAICLQRPSEPGRAYCAVPCGGGCPAGYDCVGLVGGGDACVPRRGFCGDGVGLPRGAYCWGPGQCGPDACVVFPGDARCSPACRGPADCGAGTLCALDGDGLPRTCLPPGDRPLGAACGWATDCAGGVCGADGRCSQWCAGGCPAGWRCAPDARFGDAPRVCVPAAPVDVGVPDAAVADGAVDASLADASLADARSARRGASCP
ncbi:MAG: matrixin family metalloprotease [Myxococcales bacterium]|nr:matrixin family metalloprotease [Myxococcales bacterium]